MQERPGLLVKLYRCFNKAEYKISSHQFKRNPKEGIVLVKLVLTGGELPIPFDLESELLNIDGCLDILYEEPLWKSENKSNLSKTKQEENRKIKSAASVIINNFKDIENLVDEFKRSFIEKESVPLNVYKLGLEVGAATYANEYALGKPLVLEKAIKRMLSRAVRKFGSVSTSKQTLTIENNIFCNRRNADSECEFTKGFVTGFLASSPKTKQVKVQNCSCRALGQVACSFEFQ